MLIKPQPTEYAPYYETYISLVGEENIIQLLDKQLQETLDLLNNLSKEAWHSRYAPGKWSIKEVIGHIADTERILSYRMLAIARGETISLPGYDDDAYVANASFDQQSIAYLRESLLLTRQSTIHLLKGLDAHMYIKRGIANDQPVTVRAIAYMIAGHELHHRRILQERYLASTCS